jgi:LacI family gluconate utilization system Gnt-I transcriptional repressor
MADVAKVAAVSAQTVSRVLRNPDGSAPQIRDRVLDAVRATKYVQNLTASHLASNRSMTIAAVIPQIATSVFAETVQGLSNILIPAGYQIIIGHTDYSHEREEALVRSLLGRRPDGFFLVGTRHTDATREMLSRAAVPVVEGWAWTRRPIDQLVGFSNHDALAETVAYVRRAGYKRPTFVGSLRPGDDRAQERLKGYLDGMKQDYPDQQARVVVVKHLPYNVSTGSTLLRMAREQQPDSDVLMFSSDLFASGALLACQRLGISVPSELAITGFGDYEVSRELHPALTTISVPTTQIGEEAAKIILQRIRGEKPAKRKLDLGFRLIARGSA